MDKERQRINNRRSYYRRQAKKFGLHEPTFGPDGYPVESKPAACKKSTTSKPATFSVPLPSTVARARQLLNEIERLSAEFASIFAGSSATTKSK